MCGSYATTELGSFAFESSRILLRKNFVLVIIFLQKLYLYFYYLFRKYDLRGFSGGNSVVTVLDPNTDLTGASPRTKVCPDDPIQDRGHDKT